MIDIIMGILQFIPLANVVDGIVGAVSSGAEPIWWAFGLKLVQSIVFLQVIMPYLERFTRSTANTWDDGLYAKLKVVLAFSVEIMGALVAIDPKIGARIKAITGPRD